MHVPVVVALVLIALCSCGPASPQPSDPTDPTAGPAGDELPAPPPDEAAPLPAGPPPVRLQAMFERLEEAITIEGADCDTFAQGLGQWNDRYLDEYPQLYRQVEGMNMPEAERTELETRIEDIVIEVVVWATECAEHDPAQEAFDEFNAFEVLLSE